MGNPYSPILTSVGLLQNGALTLSAREKYVDEVVTLLATGNADGKGGSPFTKIFSALVPLPPIPGPSIVNVTTLQAEPVFWFGPDPVAALLATNLRDKKVTPFWNAMFPDLLFGKTAAALDIPGTTPFFPVFDVSGAFDFDLPIPFTRPQLAAKLNLPPPQLLAKLGDLGLKLSFPVIPSPPIPPQISFPDLGLPGVPSASLPSLVLQELFIGLIKLPFDVLKSLVLPPDISLALNVPSLPGAVFELAFQIIFDLLVKLGLMLILPKVIIASVLIYLKNIVAMICTDIVGLLLGAGGIAKGAAILTGLV